MVNSARLFRLVLTVQFLAVLGYCFSHLAVSLLKLSPPVFSSQTYMHPAVWGINFLFVSSGFLVHMRREELMPANVSWLSGTAAYLTGRFWLLAIPCYAAYIFDIGVLSFRDFGPSPNLALIGPSLLTLSQTWVYAIIGDTSLGQPLNGANVAWLGSCLLFTSIFYALTRSLWARMSGPVAVGVVIFALAAQAAQYWLLEKHTGDLLAYDSANFSTKNADYSLFTYFFQFSPYTYLASFIAGVALADVCRHGLLIKLPFQVGLAVAAFALLFADILPPARYIGANALLLALLAWLARDTRQPEDEASLAASVPVGWRSRFATLTESAYTVWTLHLVMLLPFTAKALDYSFAAGKIYLTGRVLVVAVMIMMLCAGLHIYIFEPLRRAILTRLDVEAGNDRFI